MFFVRNIYLWIIVFTLFVGGGFLFLCSFTYYTQLKEQIISSKTQQLKVITPMLAGRDYKPSDKKLNSTLDELFGSDKKVSFARALDTESGRILSSITPGESGAFFDKWVNFKEGKIVSQSRRVEDTEVRSLTYQKDDFVLWLGINKNRILHSTLWFLAKQALFVAVVILILIYLFYYLERRYLLGPMKKLRSAIQDLGEEKFAYSKKKAPKSLGELLASFNDIARDIRSLLKHQEQAAEMKTDFISTTAHQLRTPLSGINWALESVLMDPDNTLKDSQKKRLKRAHKKSKELIKMVKGLLMSSSLEKGKLGFHYEKFDLIGMTKQIIEDEKKQAEEVGVELYFRELQKDKMQVKADKERIKWVIRNLVENAIRYTDEEGSVKVNMEIKQGMAQTAVEDNGMGIAEEDKEHIFERFYRSERAIQKHNEGNGLGLYIVKRIIEQHEGEIWFSSQKGQGTTFFFTLPLG